MPTSDSFADTSEPRQQGFGVREEAGAPGQTHSAMGRTCRLHTDSTQSRPKPRTMRGVGNVSAGMSKERKRQTVCLLTEKRSRLWLDREGGKSACVWELRVTAVQEGR